MTDHRQHPCNIVIVGASGDLSRRKLIPALFSLYCNDLLPQRFNIFGFARSQLDDQQFRRAIMANLTCRYVPEAPKCERLMDEFLARCFYHQGSYDDPASFEALHEKVHRMGAQSANALFYMAIPPSIFVSTAESIKPSGLNCDDGADCWTRVVLEKPFGRDSVSSAELLTAIGSLFSEEQTYRIDHYLGKEVIQNLMILRFANVIFEPIWNHRYVDKVTIHWSETIGCQGRAGYFDHYGIIRDVVQNHLIQILALVGMEPPIRFEAEAIRDEKVKLLRCVEAPPMSDVVVGQYQAAEGEAKPGYLDDPEVPSDSITPTYVRTVLWVNNPRWYGVPFHISAGKALDRSVTEIRIRFKSVPYSIFRSHAGLAANELVIRVQPNEAIELQLVNKMPGLALDMRPAALDLFYKEAFTGLIPDAYERLLLDVVRGDRSLFLRADELAAAWEIVTPVLHELEERQVKPQPYAYGSTGPK